MGRDCGEAQGALNAQMVFFRLAERDHGITQKMVAASTRYSRTIVGEWARGEAVMGLAAFREIAKMKEVPCDLLSILIDGTDRSIVDSDDERELDTVGENADAVAIEVRRARHPRSPGGIEITEGEEEHIRAKVVKLRVA